MNLDTPTKVIIGLHQEDERAYGANDLRPNLDMAIIVLGYNPNGNLIIVASTEYDIAREMQLELNLEPGTYLILPKYNFLVSSNISKELVDALFEGMKTQNFQTAF